MAINFLTTTNTLPEIQINDAGNNPRLELQESGSVSGGISTTGGALVFEASSGIEKARILSTGQFLIGHTSYYYAGTYLQVGNTSDNQNGLQITTSTTGNGYILFGDGTGANSYIGQIRYNHSNNSMVFNTNGAVAMTINSTGKVGVGHDTLYQKFTVNGNIDIRGGDGSFLTFNNGDANIVINYNGTGRDLSFKTYDGSSNAERMRITKAGKVGIGTSSPGMMLHVKGGDEATMKLESTSGEPAIFWAPGGSSLKWENRASASRWQLYSYDEAEWVFNIYDAKIGIGTVSPSYKVDIAGDQMRLGDSNQTTTYLRVEATNTSGAPARAVGVILKGYEGRGIGTIYQDVTYSGEEWYNGMPYGGGFNYYQIGFDASGGQPEYATNSLFRIYHNGSTILSTYGSGTHTGTAAKYLAVTSSGEIIETGSGGNLPGGPYLPLAGGTMTGTNGVIFPDNFNLKLGAGQDLELFHNGTQSYIQNSTGDLTIINYTDDKDIIFKSDDGSGGVETYFYLDGSGSRNVSNKNFRIIDSKELSLGSSDDLKIFHDGTDSYIKNTEGIFYIDQTVDDGDMKFRCDSGSGGLTSYFYLDGSAVNTRFAKDIKFSDSVKALFGGSGDLEIYHDGSHSRIKDVGTGHLVINATDFVVNNSADTKNMIIATDGGSVNLYYDASQKFRTISAGAEVTGNLFVSSNVLVGSAQSYFGENVLRFKSAGAAYIDMNTTGQSIIFRTSVSSALDTTALTITDDGYATFVSGIQATNTNFTGTMNIAGGIYHIGDTNTYFGFDEGNDTFRVVTGGGERLGINNSGVRIGGGARVTTILDEDNMASNSNTALATQQSIKAYVDTSITGSTSFRGTWDPDAGLNGGYGNPNLNTVTKQDGYYYICSDNGSATPNGAGTTPNSWHTGDWVVYNSNLGSSGEWQKIDNSSVISGTGTGGKLVKWSGSGTSETLTDSIIQDNGSGVGIGTAPATGIELHVDGDVRVDATNGIAARQIRSGYFSSGQSLQLTSGTGGSVILGDSSAARLTLASDDSATFAGDIALADSKAIKLGSGGDLEIYHDGSNSYIKEQGTGVLYIQGSGNVQIEGINGENMIICNENGSVQLHYNNVQKFQTTSTGVSVTGNMVTSGDVVADTHFNSSDTNVTLSTASNGTVFLRPNGKSSTTGQSTFTTSLASIGTNATFAGDVTISNATPALNLTDTDNSSNIALSSVGGALIVNSTSDQVYQIGGTEYFRIATSGATFAGSVMVNGATQQTNTELNVNGAMQQDGKTSWSDSSGLPLTTTGRVVAGLVGNSGGNGASALYMFTCYGGNGYQRIVYSIKNSGGTWIVEKDIDEGQNAFDVVASTPTSGSAVTFTFKARSTSQSFTASVWIEHIGSSIDTQYVG